MRAALVVLLCSAANVHRPARFCLSAPLSLDGGGDACLRDSEHFDGAGVSGGDEAGGG